MPSKLKHMENPTTRLIILIITTLFSAVASTAVFLDRVSAYESRLSVAEYKIQDNKENLAYLGEEVKSNTRLILKSISHTK